MKRPGADSTGLSGKCMTIFSLLLLCSFFLSMPPSDVSAAWTTQVVDAPKFFNNFYSRAIATEKTTNLPHIVYGGDRLYHAYFNGSQWQVETIDNSPFTGEFASLALDANNKAHISYYDVGVQDLK